ncbi:acetyltransferase [Emticicia fluvialis]|uniref:acetyltransferase n=1 Tax=Emticicia fluvialis TaxID=2974474 RepID=UPI00216531DA|nr:acetyltransferase [Emticicia fluvialis]
MNYKALIIGAGTYGQVYCEYLKEEYEVIGFVDDNTELIGKNFCGVPVIGDFDYITSNIDNSVHIFVPIGHNQTRVALIKKLEAAGYSLPSFIHKSSQIHESVAIGKTVYALPDCNIMPFSTIEDYVMISMGVNIAHHTILGQGSFYSQGTNIGAGITVSQNTFCGQGCTLSTGVHSVGQNVLIGSGAVIIKDVPDNAVVVGNPGRIIRYNNPD